MVHDRKWENILLLSFKIAIASFLSIFTAELLHLQYASSAAIVALLTLLTTRKGTRKLATIRILSFALIMLLGVATFHLIRSESTAFGIFMLLTVFLCEALGWRATISVNAVIGTHMLMIGGHFTGAFFLNEFLLVFIGNTYAYLLNLLQDSHSYEAGIAKDIRRVEERMQFVLREIGGYLSGKEMSEEVSVWDQLNGLERDIRHYITEAYEYQENTFRAGAEYYAAYFEMRAEQLSILHNLHTEMRKIRTIPAQAAMVAEYVDYLAGYVTELNVPTEQKARLQDIFEEMKTQPLPAMREEFENRAVLYHILMDLDEFLIAKEKFVTEFRKEHRTS